MENGIFVVMDVPKRILASVYLSSQIVILLLVWFLTYTCVFAISKQIEERTLRAAPVFEVNEVLKNSLFPHWDKRPGGKAISLVALISLLELI